MCYDHLFKTLQFALEFHHKFVPLLFNSLNHDLPIVRRIAANSFGWMAVGYNRYNCYNCWLNKLNLLSNLKSLAFMHHNLIQDSDIAELKEIAVQSLDFVCRLMERPDARLEECIGATEDAISTVIKIIGNCNEKMIGAGRMNEVKKNSLPLSNKIFHRLQVNSIIIE